MRKYLDSNVVYETKDMDKKDWLKLRKTGIGGSDAASVLGLNPYKSSMSVYLEKIPLTDDIKFVDNIDHLITGNIDNLTNIGIDNLENNETDDLVEKNKNYKMELGNKLEEFVAKEFCLKTGKKVRNINGILKNDKYPFAIANIDRAVVGEKAFLECKVTGSYFKKVWEVGVPIHIQIQVNHYMAVTGATHCYVCALVSNEGLYIHKIDRDEEIIEEIMNMEAMFWNQCVLGDNIPSPDGSSDYSNVLKEYYKNSKEEEILLFEQENIIERYDEINMLSKEIENEKKKIEQHIQNQMKEYEIAYIGDRRVTWKKQERKSIDTKRLKKELPEIANKYMKTTISRVFRI